MSLAGVAFQAELALSCDPWIVARDGDERVRWVFDRHYSRRHYTDGRTPKLFVGPGEKMVLITPGLDAIFVWRRFIDDAIPRQEGVNWAVFRNESPLLSSDLVRSAVKRARCRWPSQRLYTYVDPKRVRRKRDPGRCFIRAGWTRCGVTRGGLVILDLSA